MDVESEQLVLRLLTVDEAARIIRRARRPGELWAAGFPTFEHIDFLTAFIADSAAHRDPGPFGLRLVIRKEDGLVIGGAGFFGTPDEYGSVELVIELDRSVRQLGYGSQVLASLLRIARQNGARIVTTSTSIRNLAGQRAIENAGVIEVRRDDSIVHYALELRREEK